ncbi:hypothetical protein IVA79_18090 [Bradyrhizobium sp. 138]|uniref:hypothetical protein n=1 Tax=Bradyrhizobium sp. 138 TaxID=2782615 RepID=UPI001FF9E9E2|nr:hypothetical protein [Bradyrhizobium sp. 138]MCK1735797.1 hypothetical protein [Bradyrhizobium sp. 138]
MDTPKRLPDFPDHAPGRFGYSVAKVSLAAVPFVGDALQEILERAIGEPLRKRQEEWFKEIGKGLQDLQDRLDGFDPRTLGENPAFVGVVYEATDQAMRAQDQERLDALRNVVLNTAAGIAIDDVLRGRFMGYVGRFSTAHVRVLKAMDNPSASPAMVAHAKGMMMGSFWPVLLAALPEFGQREDLLEVIVAELEAEGLVVGSSKVMMSGGSIMSQKSTAVGRAFLQFISTPQTA